MKNKNITPQAKRRADKSTSPANPDTNRRSLQRMVSPHVELSLSSNQKSLGSVKIKSKYISNGPVMRRALKRLLAEIGIEQVEPMQSCASS